MIDVRDARHDDPVERQALVKLLDGRPRIPQMLEHVEAPDRVERPMVFEKRAQEDRVFEISADRDVDAVCSISSDLIRYDYKCGSMRGFQRSTCCPDATTEIEHAPHVIRNYIKHITTDMIVISIYNFYHNRFYKLDIELLTGSVFIIVHDQL